MNPELWKKVQTIVDQVLDLPEAERERLLLELAGGDAELEKEVRALLDADAKANDVLNKVDIPDGDATATMTMAGLGQFDHYILKEKIGVGGMGLVYKARDTRLDREVAIKFLSPQLNEDPMGRQRFLAEAKSVSQLDHPNICVILDMGETPDQQLYFSMPYYEGDTLRDKLKNNPPSVQRAVDIILQICEAIKTAHENNIVHRDIKPANILITNDNVVKVLDFGIAKVSGAELTQTGQAIGTVSYMSPEQLQGETVDHRSDIWSLGVLFYELMSTHRPFKGKSNLAISNAIIECQPNPIADSFFEIPPIVEKIVAKTLTKNPLQRYDSVAEMISDIKQLQQASTTERRLPIERDTSQVADTGGSYSSSSQFSVSETLSAITAELSKFVGPSARIMVNTVAQQTDTIEALCQRLADELADNTERQAFLNSVNHLQVSMISKESSVISRSAQIQEDVTEKISTIPKARNKTIYTAVALTAVVVIGVVIFFQYAFKPETRYTVVESVEALVEETVPVRGVTSDTITLGMTAAFSGVSKELGRSVKIGIEARLAEINEAGGIHGRKISLKALDDGNEPEQAALNVNELLAPEQGVFAMIGNVGSSTLQAVLPSILENKTILFGAVSGSKLLRGNPPDRYVFNYRASYAEEITALVKYYVEVMALDPKKFAVFYQNDSYGLDGLASVEQALRAYEGAAPLASASYERNTSQIEEGAAAISAKQRRLDVIIVVGNANASALFTKSLRDGGYKGEIANVSFVGSKALAEKFSELGNAYAEGVLISQVVPYYDSYATGVLTYREALEKYFPTEQANFVSLEGYVVASIFCEALERVGRDLDTEPLIEVLQAIDLLDLGIGPNISFSMSKHQASQYIWGTRLNAEGGFEQVELTVPEIQ